MGPAIATIKKGRNPLPDQLPCRPIVAFFLVIVPLFFTHARNAGRSDLGCPFGCRDAHRRQNAIARSSEYYRAREGKIKKKHLNAARSEQNRLSEPSYDKNDNDDFGSEVVGATVRHIQQVTSLIEERLVGLAEIAAMLDKILRQHSIDSAVKLPYAAF